MEQMFRDCMQNAFQPVRQIRIAMFNLEPLWMKLRCGKRNGWRGRILLTGCSNTIIASVCIRHLTLTSTPANFNVVLFCGVSN